jgi:phosphatidylserine/phosphatidylglycerophosphate/cardiolipin synthase-like enzyme
MKIEKTLYVLVFALFVQCAFFTDKCFCQQFPDNLPVISNLTYDNITQTGVTLFWITDVTADSKIKWMVADSNYKPLSFTDSIYDADMVTNHVISIVDLQPATIYKYAVFSQSPGGAAVDSGYFITQSLSAGQVNVYFNHSVDVTVSTGEHANGNVNFENLFIKQIDSAKTSIDITLWELSYYTSISAALIRAKQRGVAIRFVYNHTVNTSVIDSLQKYGIPVLKRKFDTIFSMHNKFWVFDYRYNSNPHTKYLWTGSANVSHPQFHTDKNNIIIIQDESLCAVYTREFEEMWGSHTDIPDSARAKFGTQKTDNVPHILNVAGTRMEVYFSPSDSVSRFLSNLMLTKPTHSLFFCMLKFELPAIEAALHTIHNNGKQLKGVFDLANSLLTNSAYPRMKGLPVANTWSPPADVYTDSISGLIHHKYFLIDANTSFGNKIISTGSFNWEVPADIGNDENSLTIFNSRVNNLYFQELHRRFLESGGGIIVVNGINSDSSQHFRFLQNYPNPFCQTTTISYKLLSPGSVSLSIFDIQGREIETLVNSWQENGSHEVEWNASRYPGGVYYYRLTADGFNLTQKMILAD